MEDPSPRPAPFTRDEVDTAIRLMDYLCADRLRLQEVAEDQRRALLIAAGQLTRPDRHVLKAASRVIRRNNRKEKKDHDIQILAATENRLSQRKSFYAPPTLRLEAGGDADLGAELHEPLSCYVCKEDYRRVHFHYHSMCADCARLNYAKRGQTARLDGRIALVTGARLKIGYQIGLLLLRAGARVIATTRFPNDAAERYASEPDHAAWKDRLEIHGLDLRHAPSVEVFTQYLDHALPHLDFLINNAAQTVRRPPAFYQHLMPGEARPLEALAPAARALLGPYQALRDDLRTGSRHLALPAEGTIPGGELPGVVAWHGGAAAPGLTDAALLSQMACTPDDHETEPFPPGELDADRQQIDHRRQNSWRLKLDQVSTPELLEVHLVNAVAPFILNSKLKPLMMRSPTGDRHIVNVSAMEAQFARNKKTDKHPHTNMAKAALNMMTRTSASDYAEVGIHMNSVDTGWVTDEDPRHHIARKQEEHDFFPPLDSLDGAARVLDPIFSGYNSGTHWWGLFLKDYRPVPW